ncbi:phosphoglucomutase/phosphomannomutase family protein [Limnoraphis robusta Tam1]|uniref:phosphoglucomutase/phosphomannomutase family protein n=1 Tax=Limnoraphis robusta TaxID=1118279 RepID=UPI002B21DC0F|nr:phosphoglucomutase/phosphomannomutase family protein [Limnoraphis robusta]MEA5541707.1 phosphoglucomutase/phosphomannomutase family protein [Limnoraphis robusta Tam1]
MSKPIKFGTDGWRGVIADDFTFERVALVAPLAAQVLEEIYGHNAASRTVFVGYDRRFLAEEFALVAAQAIQAAGYDVKLSQGYAPTPAYSLVAHQQQALGAVVLTASHNPGKYLGLKVKGAFGGSVGPDVTQEIEARLDLPQLKAEIPGTLESFDPWPAYCETLQSKVDIEAIKTAINQGKLTVFVDVMHGAATGGLARILGDSVREINSNRDPLFDGGAPEPLPKYIPELFRQIKTHKRSQDSLAVGFVFDGDSDRVAAVDGEGNFLSSQILIPILIEHLATRRGFGGEIVKTVSGSDLIPRIAKLYDLSLYETPIGYKYIADRMLSSQVLVGGEESGGVGYGVHIPERDALLSALFLLEAIVQSGEDLSQIYRRLQDKVGFSSVYDRIDLPLASMEVRSRLVEQLENNPPKEIAGQAVTDCLTVDGYKFRLADDRWLLIRFSGTEPVLRLYCEAADQKQVNQTLSWAKDWASSCS